MILTIVFRSEEQAEYACDIWRKRLPVHVEKVKGGWACAEDF